MANKKLSPPETPGMSEQEALVGYQMAISLWTHERTQNWARFSVLLTANSILVAVLVAMLTSGSSSSPAPVLLSIVGIVLCVAWFLITRRGFDYQDYYVKSVREIEEKYLGEGIRTVSRGADFAAGKSVTVTLGGKPQPVKMGTFSSLMTATYSAQAIIILFFSIYILVALFTILQIIRWWF